MGSKERENESLREIKRGGFGEREKIWNCKIELKILPKTMTRMRIDFRVFLSCLIK